LHDSAEEDAFQQLIITEKALLSVFKSETADFSSWLRNMLLRERCSSLICRNLFTLHMLTASGWPDAEPETSPRNDIATAERTAFGKN
jgi:hypothetical protein